MNRPAKGSPEAYAWAEKMRKTRERIRKAGLATEKKFFSRGAPLDPRRNPGAYWHDEAAHVAGRYRRSAQTATEKHIYAGMEMAHADSARAARKLGMNPKRKRKMKKNPIAIYNPPKVVGTIYNNAIEIRAQKTSTLRGYYKHIFDSGKVQILGLDNGDVLLHHKGGKRLWMSRKDYERSGQQH